MGDETSLERFKKAQQNGGNLENAYAEIAAGRKTSHWIWYIFPQLKSLGFSHNAQFYGIADFKEACDYLRDPELFKQYNRMVTLVEQQLATIPLIQLMNGDTDAKKLCSSLTLFKAIATYLIAQNDKSQADLQRLLTSCNRIFIKIAPQRYYPCAQTLSLLTTMQPPPEHVVKKKAAVVIATQESPTVPVIATQESATVPAIATQGSATAHEPAIGPAIATHATTASSRFFIPSAEEKPSETHKIIKRLDDYINTRTNEWSFHFNFLKLISVFYFIQDLVLGTDHFNSKSREIKMSAASKLRNQMDPQRTQIDEPLTEAETNALHDGRLGAIVAEYGGLDKLLEKKIDKPADESSTNSL